MKTKDLPKEFWEERRRMRNKKKSSLHKQSLRERNAQKMAQEEQELAQLSEVERAERREAAFQERLRVKKEREAKLQAGYESGIRFIVDCSYSHAMNERELRSLAKQLELCSAVNKRAKVPVRLEFCGFKGELKCVA